MGMNSAMKEEDLILDFEESLISRATEPHSLSFSKFNKISSCLITQQSKNQFIATNWLQRVVCNYLITANWLQPIDCNELFATNWLEPTDNNLLIATNLFQLSYKS